jgi:hypothetical protein
MSSIGGQRTAEGGSAMFKDAVPWLGAVTAVASLVFLVFAWRHPRRRR